MLTFFPPSRRRRAAAFEQWQTSIDETLRRREVAEALGPLSTHLIRLNEEAYLPNTRHATVEVPDKYVHTERMAMLPRLAEDPKFSTGDTLLEPTPKRYAKIATQFRKLHPSATDQEITDYTWSAQRRTTKDERDALVNTEYAVGGCQAYFDEDRGIYIAGRPLISMRWDAITDRVGRQASGVHELVHAYDCISEMGNGGDIIARARTETRAYRASAVIFENAIQMHEAPTTLRETEISFEVEQWREECHINADTVLKDSFTLDEEAHNPLIFNMFITGMI